MNIRMVLSAALILSVPHIQAADAEAGKTAAMTCQGCHGPDGNSPNPMWPSLAGQQPTYIKSQLEAFRSGSRVNAVMQGFAASLADDTIANLAAYYAALAPKVPAGVDGSLTEAGKAVYSGTCASCHGANAEGSEMYPRLASQQPDYTFSQLKAFKSGDRVNAMMNAMVAALSEDDMKAVSAYVASLP